MTTEIYVSLDRMEHWEWGHDSKLNDDPEEKYLCPHMNGENRWPSDFPGFEEFLSVYYRKLRDLARQLTRAIALAVDLPENYFDNLMTHPGCTASLIRYPPQKPQAFDYGFRPHTDVECKPIQLHIEQNTPSNQQTNSSHDPLPRRGSRAAGPE